MAEATAEPGKPDEFGEQGKEKKTLLWVLVVSVVVILLLLIGAVYAAYSLSNGVSGVQGSVNGLGNKITTEITGLKTWANNTFITEEKLNKELDKRLAKKKSSGAKAGKGGKKYPAHSQGLRVSRQQEVPRREERAPPPDGCKGGQWVRSEGGVYQCFIQKRVVMRPPVDDSAKVVAEACAPLGIVSNGHGGWKCLPEPVAAAPAQSSPMPQLYSLNEEKKPEYSIKQSAMWAAIGCGVNLLVGGGGGDCLRGAVVSGAGDAIGQHFGGPNGGHVGGAVGTIGSAAKVKRAIPQTSAAAGGTPVNPPLF